jgi:cytochrome c-type biogenesis protein CcmE
VSTQEPSQPRRPPRAKWAAGITLIVAGIGALAVWAIASPDAIAYYKTPSEVHSSDTSGRNLRVGGRVAAGSLHRSGALVRFVVTDGHDTVPVVYRGDVPDTLKEHTDVVAEGRLQPDGTLLATRVLAKCSSKFVPADKADEHLGRA